MIRCSSVNNTISNFSPEPTKLRRSSSELCHVTFSNLNSDLNELQENYSNIKNKLRYYDLQCPSSETRNIELIPNIYISLILNDLRLLMLGIPVDYTIEDLTNKVSSYLNISTDKFELLFDETFRKSNITTSFSQLNIKPGSTVTVLLNVHEPSIVLSIELMKKVKEENITKDTIFVHSRNLDNKFIKTSRVDIERLNFTKHFLGGLKHKTTGIEYHHAVTQTRAITKVIPLLEMYSRDTQTYKVKNRTIDNAVTTSTQMTKTAYYVSNVTDRVVTPHLYQTADELEALIISKVIIIQKYYRRWLAKIRVNKLREIRQTILNYQSAEKQRKANEMAKRLEALFDKRRCPLYNDDFDLLFNAIELWRKRQIANISPDLPTSARKAIMCQIMDDQHEWIMAVDRLKINSIKLLNFRAKKNKLVKVSKPLVWKDRFGEEIEMDSVNTTRGKEVYEIYKSLSMDFFNIEERLDILLTLKRLITNRPEKICSDLLILINREADLIMRNVAMPLLKGLRTRINSAFLILCRLPSFNPGVEKYLSVPTDPLDLRGTFQLCRYCNNYLKNSQFMFSVKSKRLGACRTCTRLFNHAMPRQELSPYRHILNLLQKAEESYQDNSKMAFIFSEIDIKHLITKIWDSKSILSSNEDLENLIFIRWNQVTEWSPWNTALMTQDEAEAHFKLDDPCSAYCDKLLNRIHQKQIAGHNDFVQLNELADKFTVHNLKDEQHKIEMAKKADQKLFIQERAVRFE